METEKMSPLENITFSEAKQLVGRAADLGFWIGTKPKPANKYMGWLRKQSNSQYVRFETRIGTRVDIALSKNPYDQTYSLDISVREEFTYPREYTSIGHFDSKAEEGVARLFNEIQTNFEEYDRHKLDLTQKKINAVNYAKSLLE